ASTAARASRLGFAAASSMGVSSCAMNGFLFDRIMQAAGDGGNEKLAIIAASRRQGRRRKRQKPAGEAPMDETVRKISADDINPRYNWGRELPALGTMGVNFEQRVDYLRLLRYLLS